MITKVTLNVVSIWMGDHLECHATLTCFSGTHIKVFKSLKVRSNNYGYTELFWKYFTDFPLLTGLTYANINCSHNWDVSEAYYIRINAIFSALFVLHVLSI
jgi:hypothetical protein